MATEYGFTTIDASRSIHEVFEDLRRAIKPLLPRIR
jgi:thymidylate kinase